MPRRRRGFTLIEVLIVIIVTAILAGTMMAVMTKIRAKARATVIMGNMRTIQEATLLYYADTGQWFPESASEGWVGNRDAGTFLLPYLDRKLAARFSDADGQYFVWLFEDGGNPNPKYYVVCKVDDRFESYETRQALEKGASSPPFFNADGEGHRFRAVKNPGTGYSGNTQITLLILKKTF